MELVDTEFVFDILLHGDGLCLPVKIGEGHRLFAIADDEGHNHAFEADVGGVAFT